MLSLDCWCNLIRATSRYCHCVFIHRHWRFKAKSTVPNLTSIKLWYVTQFYQWHISKSGIHNSRSIFRGTDCLLSFLLWLGGMWTKWPQSSTARATLVFMVVLPPLCWELILTTKVTLWKNRIYIQWNNTTSQHEAFWDSSHQEKETATMFMSLLLDCNQIQS